MESFEQLCRVSLEAEGFAVSGNVKFFVRRKTKRRDRREYQTHGYEVDLVGARARRLVLAEVKSYLGSRGVSRQGFTGLADKGSRSRVSLFKLFNDRALRTKVVAEACKIYGYTPAQVQMRLYVGKFAGGHEHEVREHLERYKNPPVQVVGLKEVVTSLVQLGKARTYIDDPVVMTVKALAAADRMVGNDDG
jgi:hypothetical protein